VPVAFGPLRPAHTVYSATVTGCDPQCRLVGFTLSGDAGLLGSTLALRGVSGAVDISSSAFADRARWRTSIVPGNELPTLSSGLDSLQLTVTRIISNTAVITYPVYVNDSAIPVPTYAAGPIPTELLIGAGTVDAPGAGPVPATLVGTAAVLPRVGTIGRLVDLSTLDSLRPGDGRLEVWLAPGTPGSVVQALRDHGLSIVDDESIGNRLSQLRAQGPAVALRYLLVVTLVGLALAVAALAIAVAVERPGRAEELIALRWQGLRSGIAARVAYGGYLAFAVVAVVLGVVTALLAGRLIGPPRVFGDGWSVLAVPSVARSTLIEIISALAAAVIVVALLAAGSLARAVRRDTVVVRTGPSAAARHSKVRGGQR
jgi:hypothetical protein